MSVSLDRGTTIGRLRLRAATADPNALRMRGGTVLGALDLQPPAMPEQAILCIRTLQDPMPGGLDLRFAAAPRPEAWEAAMRGAVGEALRHAARPALGALPANAEAVLFADSAELLACAARDALRGALAIHWWWTHLLGGERSPAAVVREWTRAPAYVPAAVELLAAQGESAAFARAVAPAEAVRLLAAVLRAYALPALAFEVVNALTTSFVPPPAPPVTEPRDSSPPDARPRAEPFATPPWRAVVPDLAPAALTVEQSCLVALALVLRRAPALVRSARFAGQVAAWIASERRGERWRDLPVASRPLEPEATAAPCVAMVHKERGESSKALATDPARRVEELRQPESRRLDPRQLQRDVTAAAAQSAEQPADHRLDTALETAVLGRARQRRGHGQHAAVAFAVDAVGVQARGMEADGRSPERRQPRSPIVDETPVPHAARAPEIIASSAGPEATGPQPLPIDFDIAIDSDFAGVFFLLNVAIALGLYSDFTSPVQCGIPLDVWDFLALTGGALAEMANLEDDPIGPLLAALANRKEGAPPGADFVPPRGESRSAWLDATVERIRERLALAGIEDPSHVVRRYGRVTTTPAHLDVYLALAAHPIEIRLASLDRDPGWIPAAGRHVAFHFD
jgi:hypothetical protein